MTKNQFNKVGEKYTYTFIKYVDGDSLTYTHHGREFAKIPAIKIEKDLREKISFSYQLDFLGYGDTIVYENACVWSALCNRNTTTLRVFYDNDNAPYSEYDITGKGTEIPVTGYVLNPALLSIKFATRFSWEHLSICDKDGNLMFATNKAGETFYSSAFEYYFITLSAVNKRKVWKKI